MKVMVAHTDPLIVAYLATILDEFQCDVVSTAPRLDDAKRDARQIEPDMAFIDARLADGNKGYRLATHLAARYKTHVIMMSDELDGSDITRFDGMFNWIRMPYSEEEITEELGEALRDRFRAASIILNSR
jgi:DNA-binding NarL/FixJ family response regulator